MGKHRLRTPVCEQESIKRELLAGAKLDRPAGNIDHDCSGPEFRRDSLIGVARYGTGENCVEGTVGEKVFGKGRTPRTVRVAPRP